MDAKRKAKTRSHSSSPEEKKSRVKRLREAEAERSDDDQDNAAHRSQFPSVDHLQVVQCNIRESYPVYHPESLDHHDCSPGTCRPNIESEASMKNYARTVHSPLILPLLFGWNRNARAESNRGVNYITPCGKTLSSIAQVYDFLLHIGSILPVQCFTFDVAVNIARKIYIPRHTVKAASTLTPKNAQFEIPTVNCYVKDNPAKFTYVNKVIMTEAANDRLTKEHAKKRVEWCTCSTSCSNDSADHRVSCLCLQLAVDDDEEEESPGYQHGLLLKEQKCVSECSVFCKCPSTCRNRVSSSTVPWRVLLYYFPGKGYGVRATCDIPKGAFIGMYTGQLLTEKEVAREGRPDTYYFTLLNLDEEDSHDQMKKGTLEYDKLFTLDAQNFGNFTRFLNHSCDPNLFPQPMFREYASPLVYHIGFFTSRAITAGDELTWDYKYQVGSAKYQIHCRCGSVNCRGRLL